MSAPSLSVTQLLLQMSRAGQWRDCLQLAEFIANGKQARITPEAMYATLRCAQSHGAPLPVQYGLMQSVLLRSPDPERSLMPLVKAMRPNNKSPVSTETTSSVGVVAVPTAASILTTALWSNSVGYRWKDAARLVETLNTSGLAEGYHTDMKREAAPQHEPEEVATDKTVLRGSVPMHHFVREPKGSNRHGSQKHHQHPQHQQVSSSRDLPLQVALPLVNIFQRLQAVEEQRSLCDVALHVLRFANTMAGATSEAPAPASAPEVEPLAGLAMKVSNSHAAKWTHALEAATEMLRLDVTDSGRHRGVTTPPYAYLAALRAAIAKSRGDLEVTRRILAAARMTAECDRRSAFVDRSEMAAAEAHVSITAAAHRTGQWIAAAEAVALVGQGKPSRYLMSVLETLAAVSPFLHERHKVRQALSKELVDGLVAAESRGDDLLKDIKVSRLRAAVEATLSVMANKTGKLDAARIGTLSSLATRLSSRCADEGQWLHACELLGKVSGVEEKANPAFVRAAVAALKLVPSDAVCGEMAANTLADLQPATRTQFWSLCREDGRKGVHVAECAVQRIVSEVAAGETSPLDAARLVASAIDAFGSDANAPALVTAEQAADLVRGLCGAVTEDVHPDEQVPDASLAEVLQLSMKIIRHRHELPTPAAKADAMVAVARVVAAMKSGPSWEDAIGFTVLNSEEGRSRPALAAMLGPVASMHWVAALRCFRGIVADASSGDATAADDVQVAATAVVSHVPTWEAAFGVLSEELRSTGWLSNETANAALPKIDSHRTPRQQTTKLLKEYMAASAFPDPAIVAALTSRVGDGAQRDLGDATPRMPLGETMPTGA